MDAPNGSQIITKNLKYSFCDNFCWNNFSVGSNGGEVGVQKGGGWCVLAEEGMNHSLVAKHGYSLGCL